MGRVDILVNSQGLNLKHNALEFNMEDWDKVFNINVKGLMMCCKEFGKAMVKQNYGRIINVSSVRGARACGNGNAGYCSSKGAVDMMTRTLSFEFAPYNITVNAVGPTLTETPMMENFFNQNPQIKETLSKSHPLGRLGTPEDMIGPSVFLASEAAGYVTGQIIYADGGLTAIG
jgi:NAD(P)-dependent dehydrogenase (short-subunit alcohol dehydrogenase family)